MKKNFRRNDRDSGPTDFSKYSSFNNKRPDFKERSMHKAVCADCGKSCDVPFKPSGDRPVYCRECFSKHKPSRY